MAIFQLLLAYIWLSLFGPTEQLDSGNGMHQMMMMGSRCDTSSCYPKTGNLLIGRTDPKYLKATSTCGLLGPQRYCIVSHLEEDEKCFICDSRWPWKLNQDPNRWSHRIENVVPSSLVQSPMENWWQSENGRQNVSIQLDLESEFQFTHLIMIFKTFRPAAMVIERSADFGKNWKVYQYFAYDCATVFPDIPRGPRQNLSDVICDSKYSQIEPSSGGEIVYNVMSQNIETEDPYGDEVVDLTKITNLRITFIKLHTLGDDLLDYRPEIEEKYYYAIHEIVIRGSCSCYGHADRCLPEHGAQQAADSIPDDMVHGRCDCTHNTNGLNCEKCLDFYNDLPWRPATKVQPNECQRCKCNRHAARCHFDRAVYEASGFESGGVCDDCQHNTQGKNCEECKPYFYKDPQRQIEDPNACLACQCDKTGSKNDGICEGEEDPERGLVAGKCYCKPNVDGPRCDRCKHGYWDMRSDDANGCKPCACFLHGTYNNQGCDKYTGECRCKTLVTGDRCDQCKPENYGLSEKPDGCEPCDCDIGASTSRDCDLTTGQCPCKEKFTGRRCHEPESGSFCANMDYYTYEAEKAELKSADLELRQVPSEIRAITWTGLGLVRVREGSQLVFEVDNLERSMDYNLVVRYEQAQDPVGWETVQIAVVRPGDPSLSGPCSNAVPADDFLSLRLFPGARHAEVQPAVCLEKSVRYEIRIMFGEKRKGYPDRGASVLIDSILLVPPTEALDLFKGSSLNEYHRTEYERYQCRNFALIGTRIADLSAMCRDYLCSVAAEVTMKAMDCKCDPTGSKSGICSGQGGQCECKVNVISRRCDQCAPGTYGFGPQGCTACECDSVGSLDNFCDGQSGQCSCRERGITGRQCNQCQPGFWAFPDCRVCQCNDHATMCDQATGACIECRDLTAGHYCERCQDGYYGDPRLGMNIPCKPCPCPGGPASGYQHADTCYLAPGTQDVVCNCRNGYEGERCNECSVNYWGNPSEIGGSCEKCDCNGNIDFHVPESCHTATGECLLCLHHTEGRQCENCMAGYFGDAKIRSCQRCVCNPLGTNQSLGECNQISGQCPCLPNVQGGQCDQCAENHYNLASATGCEACACDPTGVVKSGDAEPRLQCNEIDGQCQCQLERGGRTCSECRDYFWGDPSVQCKQCQCNIEGSSTLQCHRTTGLCLCKDGSGGPRCDECARGYTGQWPNCQPCGECFQNWDIILQDLKTQTKELIKNASNIEDTGVASQYDEQFEKMETKLTVVRDQLRTVNITKKDVDAIREQIDSLSEQVKQAKDRLNKVDSEITERTTKVDTAEEDLKSLKSEAILVTKMAENLQENATQLKETDVWGAYNITKESAQRSTAAEIRADKAKELLAESESIRSEGDQLLTKNQKDFDKQFSENQLALETIGQKVSVLQKQMPELNRDVCGAEGDPCDEICGGAGQCPTCGGRSCMDGSVSKADQALSFAKEAQNKLDQKQKEAEKLLTNVRQALMKTERARAEAIRAYETAKAAARQANQTKSTLQNMLDKMEAFLSRDRASPTDIRQLAQDVLNTTISLTPEQIRNLAEKIRQKLQKLNNIDEILAETRGNLTLASQLKARADLAKVKADKIQNTTQAVKEALEKAKMAQDKAREEIDTSLEDIETARTDLDTVDSETAEAETVAKEANASLTDLETGLKAVKVKYLQISEHAKNAYDAADKAQQQANMAEEQKNRLETDYKEAQDVFGKKESGGGGAETRAQALRSRAAQLLQMTQKHLDDIRHLNLIGDSNEVQLMEDDETVGVLRKLITKTMSKMDSHLERMNNCECTGSAGPCPLSEL